MARLAYLGTPELAVPPLRALVAAGHDIVLCVTRPDRRRGRGSRESPSPVKAAALDLDITVSHDMADLADVNAELAVVVAFGRIIPKGLLDQLPMVNLHFSLLPRWRGAAPVERAILAGDPETGVCLMEVAEGLDTGAVYAQRIVLIDEAITLEDLRQRLVAVGSDLLVEELAGGRAGLPAPVPQVGEPTMAAKIAKDELQLDWTTSAVQARRVIRLGRAWTTFRGTRLGVVDATTDNTDAADPATPDDLPVGTLVGTTVVTADGPLRLLRVQPESRGPMAAEAWVRGIRPAAGERLGSD